MCPDEIGSVKRAEELAEKKVEMAERTMHKMLADAEDQIAAKAKSVLNTYRDQLALAAKKNEAAAKAEAARIREESLTEAEATKRRVRWKRKRAIQYIVDSVLDLDGDR